MKRTFQYNYLYSCSHARFLNQQCSPLVECRLNLSNLPKFTRVFTPLSSLPNKVSKIKTWVRIQKKKTHRWRTPNAGWRRRGRRTSAQPRSRPGGSKPWRPKQRHKVLVLTQSLIILEYPSPGRRRRRHRADGTSWRTPGHPTPETPGRPTS